MATSIGLDPMQKSKPYSSFVVRRLLYLLGGDHINSPRQILIEARIVEADERFAKELGVKLGYQANGEGDQKLVGSMDLAGAGLSGFNPAAIAATLVSKNGSRILQAELSALESEG